MDRKEYLHLCQDAAVRKAAKQEPTKVKYNGIEYTPVSYGLGFSPTGAAIHTATLLDKNQNCIMQCPLDRVELV